MEFRKINNEIFYPASAQLLVSSESIRFLKQQAIESPRRRARLCAHLAAEDSLHEMLIVLANSSYVRPHLHLNKVESLHIIEGEATLFLFAQEGTVEDEVELGDYRSGKSFYYRIAEPRYHMLLIRSPFVVCHEVTNGPFRAEDTVYAPWSPDGSDHMAMKKYLHRIELKQNAVQVMP